MNVDDNKLLGVTSFAFGKLMRTRDEYMCDVRATRLIIAVEKYRLRTGELPATLDVLGHTLNRDDPFSDEGLQYTVTDASFRLWSVGWEGRSEGGPRVYAPLSSRSEAQE